jgi:hypothetical protein
MTIFAPTADPAQLATLRADLDQLRLPFAVPVRQRTRRTGTRWTAITHPGLLDQLRRAAAGQSRTARGPERRQPPRSRPPGNLDALDRLSAVYVGISGWHSGLALPSPPEHRSVCPHQTCATALLNSTPGPVCPTARLVRVDWQLHALHQLHDAARRLDPRTVAAITSDVTDWWRWAATSCGWSTAELITLRRG